MVVTDPSWPVFMACSMSSASPPRTSPITMRSGRMRDRKSTRLNSSHFPTRLSSDLVGVNGGHRSIVASLHGLQHVQCLPTAYLANHDAIGPHARSEEHTSELQSLPYTTLFRSCWREWWSPIHRGQYSWPAACPVPPHRVPRQSRCDRAACEIGRAHV